MLASIRVIHTLILLLFASIILNNTYGTKNFLIQLHTHGQRRAQKSSSTHPKSHRLTRLLLIPNTRRLRDPRTTRLPTYSKETYRPRVG